MPTPTPDQQVLKLRSPADILEAVPYLLGFEPADSLVALSLRGRRQRLGLALRVDLPGPADVEAVAAQVVSSLRADGAESVVLVGYAGADRTAADALVAAARRALDAHGPVVAEALRVHDGRWTSYTCREPGCCPPAGTPLLDRLAAPSPVGSAAVLAGHQVFPAREALAATVAPVRGLLRASMAAALDRELDRYADARAAADPTYVLGTVERARSVLAENCGGRLDGTTEGSSDAPGDDGVPPFRVSVDDAARVLVGMLDVEARDALLDGWPDETGGAALPHGVDPALRPQADRLWSELVRRAVRPGLVAPVATLLAWNLYVHHGGGALVTIALERALEDVPGYVMAEGLLSLLMAGVSPDRFATMVAGTTGTTGASDAAGARATTTRPRGRRSRSA